VAAHSEEAVRGPLTVAEARREMVAAVSPLGSEEVPLGASLVGRYLTTAVSARVTLPPFAASAMDGYAVRAGDITRVPLALPVHGEMQAGSPPDSLELSPGTCAKVMTGAPLPVGADSVVPYEWTDRGSETVLIHERPRRGNAVRRAGEDLSPGKEVLPKGRRLRAVDLAPLAASGQGEAEVGRQPQVAVVTTGDEIRPAGSTLGPGQIFDTAGPALEALIVRAGGLVARRATVGDDPLLVRRELEAAAEAADLVVTVGGVSMGDHDHVRATVQARGQLQFWRVAMRPGRPLAFGHFGRAAFLGLPGNPVSASVTFILFGMPLLAAMQGAADPDPRTVAVELLEDVEKPEGLETFHRATLRARPGRLPGARVAGNQSSGVTLSLARADCLLCLPARGASVARGSIVAAIPLP
jgi:molybdopterin molybdotransferase